MLFFYLPDRRLRRLVPFQLYDHGRLVCISGFRQEYHIGESLPCRHFPDQAVILPRAVIRQRHRIAQGVFIVVLQVRRIQVRPLYPCRHGVFFSLPRRFQQRVRLQHGIDDFRPLRHSRGCHVFVHDFFVRNKDFFSVKVVAQIPQMDEQRQHVVGRVKRRHVVRKGPRVDFLPSSGHEFHDHVLQPFEIHVDIYFQRFERFRLAPVIIVLPAHDALHDGPGTVHRPGLVKGVAVVPVSHVVDVHAVDPAQAGCFFFRKSDVGRQLPGVYHGKFGKHIQSRMGSVFLDGQNTRHVSQTDIGPVLEPVPQEIQILPLRLIVRLVFPEDTVPLVDNDDEGDLRLGIDVFERTDKVLFIEVVDIRILTHQIPKYLPPQQIQHICHGGTAAQKLLHVDEQDVAPVTIGVKVRVRCYGQSLEQRPAVDSSVVVRRQHVRRHGFSEPPGTADADIPAFDIKKIINMFYHAGLIYIYRAVSRHHELPVAWI